MLVMYVCKVSGKESYAYTSYCSDRCCQLIYLDEDLSLWALLLTHVSRSKVLFGAVFVFEGLQVECF